MCNQTIGKNLAHFLAFATAPLGVPFDFSHDVLRLDDG
jgi:hypothetical protein